MDHVVADVFSDVIAGPQCSHVITLPSTRPSPTRPLLPPVTTTHAGRNRTAGQAARAGSALLLRAPDATHIRFPATALLEPCIPLPATALRLAVTLHPLPATTLLQPCIHSPLQPCYNPASTSPLPSTALLQPCIHFPAPRYSLTTTLHPLPATALLSTRSCLLSPTHSHVSSSSIFSNAFLWARERAHALDYPCYSPAPPSCYSPAPPPGCSPAPPPPPATALHLPCNSPAPPPSYSPASSLQQPCTPAQLQPCTPHAPPKPTS